MEKAIKMLRIFIFLANHLSKSVLLLIKVLESTTSKPRFISDYFSTRSYLARAEKYLDVSRFGKQYFPTLG